MIFGKYTDDFAPTIKLAIPIMAGQIGQIFVNLADNIMVGRLGAIPLAAISLANAIFIVLIIVGMGISFALAPLISFADGAGDTRDISKFFKHSLVLNLVFAILSIGLIEICIPYFHLLKQDQEVLQMAIPYLRISMWTMIPMMIFLTFRGYTEGLSDTVSPMVAIIIGNLINIVLNYGFIYGELGLPEYGMRGAAIASFIARIAVVFILFYLIYRKDYLWQFIKKSRLFTYQKKVFIRVLKLGLPTSMQMFFEVSAFSAAAIIMGMVNSNAQAAHQVAINLASISFLICTGIAMAATIRVGNRHGQGDRNKVREAGFSAIILVVLFMIFSAILFVVFKNYLPLIYIDDVNVVSLASTLLIYAAIFQIPDGIQVTVLGALRGLQDVKIPTMITLLSYWLLGIPISYFSAIHWGFGPDGVWVGLIVGLMVSSILLSFRFYSITKLK